MRSKESCAANGGNHRGVCALKAALNSSFPDKKHFINPRERNGGDFLNTKKNNHIFFKITATYIGSIIGAGFASGQEILQFFIVFGDRAIYGIYLATFLFAYLGALVLYLSSDLGTSSYKGLFKYVLGERLGKFMDMISLFMLVGGLGIMFAGSGAIFSEHFGLPKIYGVFLVAGITCMVICGGLQGVLMANAFLVPVKMFVIIAVCTWVLLHTGVDHEEITKVIPVSKVTTNWVWSAVLYVSYNMIVAVAVLSSLGQTITKKQGVISGWAGGICLGFLAGLITMAGLAFYPFITNYQVPLLYLAGEVGVFWKKILSILIWLAILTTAIANAHGFASRLAPSNSKMYKMVGISVTMITMPLAGVEFTKLVKNIYPLFGYAGLVLLIALIIIPIYRRIKCR